MLEFRENRDENDDALVMTEISKKEFDHFHVRAAKAQYARPDKHCADESDCFGTRHVQVVETLRKLRKSSRR